MCVALSSQKYFIIIIILSQLVVDIFVICIDQIHAMNMNKNKHVNFCIVLLQVIKTEYPAVFKEKIGNKGMVKWDKQKQNIS